MNSNIKYLKDENGNVISPVTSTDSIFSSSGTSLLDFFYPVGTYYETSNTSFDPNVSWGGTWKQDTAGYCTVGANTTYDNIIVKYNLVNLQVGATTGEATHTLTVSEMPSHDHTYLFNPSGAGGFWETLYGGCSRTGDTATSSTNAIDNTGGGEAHNNTQPSIGVVRWHRTA